MKVNNKEKETKPSTRLRASETITTTTAKNGFSELKNLPQEFQTNIFFVLV